MFKYSWKTDIVGSQVVCTSSQTLCVLVFENIGLQKYFCCIFLKENRRGKPLLNLKLIKRKSTTLVNKKTKPKKEK
jgi:hypothetical protein